tara:strand:- start:44980 stop:46179 length:1200 start_codon:yes stop_codon:yes gene_type:complete
MKNNTIYMKRIRYTYCLLSIVLLSACSKNEQHKTITVKNTLAVERSFETLELTQEFLKVTDLNTVGFRDAISKEIQVTQLVDVDGDGVIDEILFQPKIAASSENQYEVVELALEEQVKAENLCFSRFVPERTDDYTWENDKVAFRVYGPVAQQIHESGKPGGTLSSGVDAWLKRVSYPIINKWYKETMIDKTGSYHEDTGEGMDNFHVGVSRGVGGIAVRNNGEFCYSKNYTKWRTITTGPLRTSFYLEYENWNAAGKLIKESKVVSLDLGNNFSKFETFITGSDEIYAGLTLHEKDGEVTGNKEKGWVSYWQPHADSEIGTSILADKNTFLAFEKYDVAAKDLSNAYANLKVVDNKVVYYAGFAWKKSKQYPTKKSWEAYLNSFSDKINNPLVVSLKK